MSEEASVKKVLLSIDHVDNNFIIKGWHWGEHMRKCYLEIQLFFDEL